MSKLTWDAAVDRRYETGIDHVVLYPQSSTGTYPTGVAWNGVTAMNENPSGAEPTDLYADNIKYLSIRSAEQYGFTIEAYTYPDEFEECDGSASLAEGVTVGQQTRKPFGVSYRTIVGNDPEDNDYGYKLHLVYNSTCSPSARNYASVNDSPEAITFSWECNSTPVAVKNHKPCCTITIDSTKADATKLDQLEALLYGGDNAEAQLPLPDAVIDIFK